MAGIYDMVAWVMSRLNRLEVWKVYELAFLATCTAAAGLAIRNQISLDSLKSYDETVGTATTTFYQLDAQATSNNEATKLVGGVLFLGCIKIIRFLQMENHIDIVAKTLSTASVDLCAFMLFFLIFFIAFACMAHFFFGPASSNYSTIWRTCTTQLSMTFGN